MQYHVVEKNKAGHNSFTESIEPHYTSLHVANEIQDAWACCSCSTPRSFSGAHHQELVSQTRYQNLQQFYNAVHVSNSILSVVSESMSIIGREWHWKMPSATPRGGYSKNAVCDGARRLYNIMWKCSIMRRILCKLYVFLGKPVHTTMFTIQDISLRTTIHTKIMIYVQKK